MIVVGQQAEEPIHLILVRHGNTFEAGQTPTQVGARTDLPLTTRGRQQAEEIASYLAAQGISPSAIYAGELKRQIEAATIVGKYLQMNQKVYLHEPALTEIDYGSWEGLSSDEISRQWPQEYANWTAQSRWADGIFGKTWQEHIRSIEHWLNHLRKIYASNDTVVSFTSNGVIRFFYSFQEAAWQRIVAEQQMETLKVKTGHFCEILLFRDTLKVKSWNVSPIDRLSLDK